MENEFDAIKNRMENIPQEISDKVKSKFDKIDAQQNKIQAKAKNAYPDGSNYADIYFAQRDAFIAGANEVINNPSQYIDCCVSSGVSEMHVHKLDESVHIRFKHDGYEHKVEVFDNIVCIHSYFNNKKVGSYYTEYPSEVTQKPIAEYKKLREELSLIKIDRDNWRNDAIALAKEKLK